MFRTGRIADHPDRERGVCRKRLNGVPNRKELMRADNSGFVEVKVMGQLRVPLNQ